MTLRQREPKTTIARRNGVIGLVPGGSASHSTRKRFVPRESRIKNSTRPPILNRCQDVGTVERRAGVWCRLTAERCDRRHQARRGQIALGDVGNLRSDRVNRNPNTRLAGLGTFSSIRTALTKWGRAWTGGVERRLEWPRSSRKGNTISTSTASAVAAMHTPRLRLHGHRLRLR